MKECGMSRPGIDISNIADHSGCAAVYARVSTEDQGKGFSLPTQIEACQKLAEHDGYMVPESYLTKPFGLGFS
jgi:hypothetical protein